MAAIAAWKPFLLGLLLVLGGCAKAPVAELPAAQVQAIVRDYLLAHPEVIQQALAAQSARAAEEQKTRQQAALDQHQTELLSQPESPVIGNPDGDVTVVEFFDYQCAHCRNADPAIHELLREDPKIRLVHKQLPILGPDSALAARAALAAARQGRYAEMHAALMKAGKPDTAAMERLAGGIGLDLARFRADRDSEAISLQLQRDYALAQALGIDGTPAFVVGRRMVAGGGDIGSIKALVTLDRELRLARASDPAAPVQLPQ